MNYDRICQKLEIIPLKYWFLFALIARVIVSFTYHSYNHADEWYQTLEAGFLAWGKKATYSPEIFWHMRNLSWSWILSLVSRTAYFFFPDSFLMQISSIQLFSVCLDLVGIFFIIKLIQKWPITHKKWWIIFFLSSHFLLRDSTRPSQEHISSVLFYASVCSGTYGYWWLAGLLASFVGAAKYASGLLSAGLYFAFVALYFSKRINLKNFLHANLGVLVGILLCGIADYVFYGIYYKSMWSYFYYLLYSGISDRVFGHQSAIVYLKFLFSQWKVLHFSFFVAGFLSTVKEVFKRYLDFALLLIPTAVFILGNLLMNHKEGRFITQIEIALWLILALGASFTKWQEKWLPRLLMPLIILNVVFSVIHLPADINKPNFSYFHLPELAKKEKNICAAIVLKRPLGAFFLTPTVNQAFWPLGKRDSIEQSMEQLPLYWYQENTCTENDFFLAQTHKQTEYAQMGCEKLDTFGSHWFKCPAGLLSRFKNTSVKNFLMDGFKPFTLPTPDIPGEEMERRQKEFEQKENLTIGSFPFW